MLLCRNLRFIQKNEVAMRTLSFIKSAFAVCLGALLFVGCGDIMDTLDKYNGDGEIRYTGAATELSVKPGWKRLIVDWKNSSDPVIKNVKVKWTADGESDSVLLDAGTSNYDINNLQDRSYAVSVYEVSGGGKESLAETTYERPYTETHEEVQMFTRIVSSHFFIGNRFILKFLTWDNNINEAFISFTDLDGTPDTLVIDKQMTTGRTSDFYKRTRKSCAYYMLPQEVDPAKPIVLHRTGYVAGCEDLITFPDYEMTNGRVYSSDFKEFLRNKYGSNSDVIDDNGAVRDSWADNVTELELDCNLTNFDDLLNLPNLKRVVLGAHRYLTTDGIADTKRGCYTVSETNPSFFALDALYQLNGLTIERYNKHYSNITKLAYLKEMGTTTLPNYQFYDLKDAKITLTPEDADGYDSYVENLIDDDPATNWQPLQQTSMVTYYIMIDLGQEVDADGITLVQKHFERKATDFDLAPSLVHVYTADNRGAFEQATFVSDCNLGVSAGETNVIPFSSTKKVRYVRVVLNSNPFHGLFGVTFAGLGLYKK